MDTNVGRVLERAIRKEHIGISELSRKLFVSRRTLYNWFKQEDLDPDIVLKVGEIIGHDFTAELPESVVRKYRLLIEADNPPTSKEITAENNSVYYWMNKYVVLLEKYNEVLDLISH